MFAARYFNGRMFPRRYFPAVGAEPAAPSTQYLFISIPSLGQTLTIAVG